MLIALLVGLGVGVLVLFALTVRRDRRYRRLLADAHLVDLARALETARTSEATTSEGLTLAWQAVGTHAGLSLRASGGLSPEAARFLLGVCARAVGRDITALLVVPGGWALVVPGPVPEGPSAAVPGDAAALTAWRDAGIEAMRAQPLVPGSLSAYAA
ncbi:MAG: hypothetical protein IT385_16810 [Deltaproteobacteria bacterium]|nr:hypothetical protein [Deltaproteobacteria bacterium]